MMSDERGYSRTHGVRCDMESMFARILRSPTRFDGKNGNGDRCSSRSGSGFHIFCPLVCSRPFENGCVFRRRMLSSDTRTPRAQRREADQCQRDVPGVKGSSYVRATQGDRILSAGLVILLPWSRCRGRARASCCRRRAPTHRSVDRRRGAATDVTFHRNGRSYRAATRHSFLRCKWRDREGGCLSAMTSSPSGVPSRPRPAIVLVRLRDAGRCAASSEFFRPALAELPQRRH